MRVLRTEMYFDPDEVRGFFGHRMRGRDYDEKNPGVAFAWFRSETAVTIDRAAIENYKVFRPIDRRDASWPDRDMVKGILDLFVRDTEERGFLRIPTNSSIENANHVDFLMSQDIVIERSPPFSLSLKGVLTSANTPLWLGTFVGGAAAWDHPVLLLVTVPGGIIAVSSASGIGRAMESGLNKWMKRLFDRAP